MFRSLANHESTRFKLGQTLFTIRYFRLSNITTALQIEVTAYYTKICIICSLFYLCNRREAKPQRILEAKRKGTAFPLIGRQSRENLL